MRCGGLQTERTSGRTIKNWDRWKDNDYKDVTNFYKTFNIQKQKHDNL